MSRSRSTDTSAAQQEVLDSLLLAYDDALASGAPRKSIDSTAMPAELLDELENTQAFLDLVERARRLRSEPPETPVPELESSAQTEMLAAEGQIGHFRIVRELGRGGYGVVFLALDTNLQREVALKVPRPEVIVTSELLRRFHREAQLAGSLAHPNLVTVYEVGRDGPFLFIASAYCRGPNLAEWLSRQTSSVPLREAARIVADLADGVEHAHQFGVLHRDIKPSNVLLEPPSDDFPPRAGLSTFTPKLTDFGLARLRQNQSEATHSGALVGTASYMAPEQALGKQHEIGNATDVYGLGAILYELLTSQRAFQGASDVDTVRRVVEDTPIMPRRLRPEIPRDLEAITLKCLEKKPERRYASAALLAQDLRRFLAGEPTRARPLTSAERVMNWARRRPALAGLLVVSASAALALAGLATAYTLHLRQSRDMAAALQAKAEASAAEASRQREIADRSLYAFRMRQAYDSLDQGEVQSVEALLAPYADGQPLEDLRGFEWYHIKKRLHGEWRTLGGRRDGVYCVAFSPDGNRLASGGQDGSIIIWDPLRGNEQVGWSAHADRVTDLDYSPDGTLLASASLDRTVKVWKADTHELIATFSLESNRALCLAFSQDSRRLATGGHDHLVRIWDLSNGEMVDSIETGHSVTNRINWYQNDSRLVVQVAASESPHVQIWNLADKSVNVLRESNCVVADPTSSQLAIGNTAGGIVVGLPDAPRQLAGHLSRVLDLAFSRSGRWLASCSEDRTIRMWDLATGYHHIFTGHTDDVCALAFAPRGYLLASGSRDGTIKLWRVSESMPDPLPVFAPRNSNLMALSPDLQYLATLVAADRVGVLDIRDGRIVHERRVEPDATTSLSVLAGPQLRLFGVVADARHASIWTPESNSLEAQFPLPAGEGELILSPDGEHLIKRSAGRVTITEVGNTKSWLEASAPGDDLPAVLFSPDGRSLAIGLESGTWIADLHSRTAHELQIHEPQAIASGGQLLAVGANANSVAIVDLKSGRNIAVLRHSAKINLATTFSPDGRTLVTSTNDGAVHIWNVATGQKMARFKTATTVLRLQFSPDSRKLAVVGATEEPLPGGGTHWTTRVFLRSGADQ
jgi:WD40 repeat protein/serine/threonine protein kinase